MTFTPALFIVYKPYARLSTGLKADGIFSMQNMLDATQSTQDLKYRPYSLTGDAGPVIKFELTPKILLAGELYWRPMRFFLDPVTSIINQRSGGGIFSKLTAELVTDYPWWRPSIYLSYEWDDTVGTNYQDYVTGGGLANTVAVTEKLSLTGSFDLLSTDYNMTNPKRDDVNMVFKIAGTYPIATGWTATADISYTQNDSSISTSYKYDRWVCTGGATYTF
jgi:hypothetical protein